MCHRRPDPIFDALEAPDEDLAAILPRLAHKLLLLPLQLDLRLVVEALLHLQLLELFINKDFKILILKMLYVFL